MLGFPVVKAWLHLSDGTLIRILKLKFDMIIKLMIEGRLENIKRQLEALRFHSC